MVLLRASQCEISANTGEVPCAASTSCLEGARSCAYLGQAETAECEECCSARILVELIIEAGIATDIHR